MAPYSEVKSYLSYCYIEGAEYALLYENGKEAHFIPGSTIFFSLRRYKEETGK